MFYKLILLDEGGLIVDECLQDLTGLSAGHLAFRHSDLSLHLSLSCSLYAEVKIELIQLLLDLRHLVGYSKVTLDWLVWNS